MPWPNEHDGTVGIQIKHIHWSKMPMAALFDWWTLHLRRQNKYFDFYLLPTINPKHINIDMYSMSLLAYIDKDLRADAWCEFSSVRIVFSRSVYTSVIVYLVDSATILVQEHHCRMPSTVVRCVAEICHASLRMLDLGESSCIFLPFCVG